MNKKILNLYLLLFVCTGCVLSFNITVKKGNIPIILTVPHSGNVCLSDIDIRSGNSNCSFNLSNDLYVDVIADKIYNKLNELNGNKPYIIKNNIHRRYVDVNRDTDCGYEHRDTELIYSEYHSYIDRLITYLTKHYDDKILLIDLHGQYSYVGDIFIGTNNGNSIDRDIEIDIVNTFNDMGYVTTSEYWKGGYTIKHYGKHINVNAIQIEIDKKYRFDEDMMNKFVSDFVLMIDKINKNNP